MRYLDGAQVRAALSIPQAIAALRDGLMGTHPAQPLRTSTPWTGGELLVMPAEGATVAGVKLVTIGSGPVRVQGVYVLFDAATLTPLVVADAVELTLIRTAALSALATDLLAPAGASRLAVVGTGPQVTIVGRTRVAAEALATSLQAELGVPVRAGVDVGADVVCLCTTSATPVLSAADLAPGGHVNAIGAHLPGHREVAADAVASCYVVVDDADAARREAGDLILAVAEGAVDDAVFATDLAAVVRGVAARSFERPTLFKSVGFGLADLFVARLLA